MRIFYVVVDISVQQVNGAHQAQKVFVWHKRLALLQLDPFIPFLTAHKIETNQVDLLDFKLTRGRYTLIQ